MSIVMYRAFFVEMVLFSGRLTVSRLTVGGPQLPG